MYCSSCRLTSPGRCSRSRRTCRCACVCVREECQPPARDTSQSAAPQKWQGKHGIRSSMPVRLHGTSGAQGPPKRWAGASGQGRRMGALQPHLLLECVQRSLELLAQELEQQVARQQHLVVGGRIRVVLAALPVRLRGSEVGGVGGWEGGVVCVCLRGADAGSSGCTATLAHAISRDASPAAYQLWNNGPPSAAWKSVPACPPVEASAGCRGGAAPLTSA